MQMYPNDHRGFKEQCYSADNYTYHDNSYNSGAAAHMMKPDHHSLPHHGHNPNHGNSYGYGGYNGHEKNGNSYGYGGYNSHEKKEHESYMAMQTWHKEDRRHDSWSMQQDNSALGGNMHHGGGMKHGGGYGNGANQGHYGPYKESSHYPHEHKKVHFWEFKGIVD